MPACVSKSGACDAILVSPDQTRPALSTNDTAYGMGTSVTYLGT